MKRQHVDLTIALKLGLVSGSLEQKKVFSFFAGLSKVCLLTPFPGSGISSFLRQEPVVKFPWRLHEEINRTVYMKCQVSLLFLNHSKRSAY